VIDDRCWGSEGKRRLFWVGQYLQRGNGIGAVVFWGLVSWLICGCARGDGDVRTGVCGKCGVRLGLGNALAKATDSCLRWKGKNVR